MEGLTMSLDDMVKKSRSEKRNWGDKPKKVVKAVSGKGSGKKFDGDRRGGGGGGGGGGGDKMTSSILARVGKNSVSMQSKSSKSGTEVVINVHDGITKRDMLELCQTVGPVGFVTVRDRGSFVAPFDKRSDAVAFCDKYNGKTLDGQPIKARLMVERAEPQRSFGGGGGGKSSLFGRALGYGNNDDDEEEEEEEDNGPKFRVTLGGGDGGRNKKSAEKKRPVEKKRPAEKKGSGAKREAVTAADLDAELDSYFK